MSAGQGQAGQFAALAGDIDAVVNELASEASPSRVPAAGAELRRIARLIREAAEAPAGPVTLTAGQAELVLQALADAVSYRISRMIGCPACDAAELARHPAGACIEHQADAAAAGEYQALGDGIAGRQATDDAAGEAR